VIRRRSTILPCFTPKVLMSRLMLFLKERPRSSPGGPVGDGSQNQSTHKRPHVQ
jgi:hypothetical protein